MGQVVEYLVITFIILGALFGILKGFVKIFFSWFSILLGAMVALNFSYLIANMFFPNYSNIVVIFLVGVILFSIVYLIISHIAHYCSLTFQRTQLGILDNLLGGIFGAAQAMIVVGLIVYWMVQLQWIDLSHYPVAMFSAYWSEKIILLIGTKLALINKLL